MQIGTAKYGVRNIYGSFSPEKAQELSPLVKTAIGGREFINELCDNVLRRGKEYAPDFLAIDGSEGGSGAAPQTLVDHMALPIAEALPRVVDSLLQSDLKARIRVVAAGKLVTSARAAWALCVGADFVNTAREHVRIVQTANQGIALNVLYPYPTAGSRAAAKQASSATGMAA